MYYNVSSLNNEKIGINREWLIEPVNLKYSDLGLVKIKSGNFKLISGNFFSHIFLVFFPLNYI